MNEQLSRLVLLSDTVTEADYAMIEHCNLNLKAIILKNNAFIARQLMNNQFIIKTSSAYIKNRFDIRFDPYGSV
ncbi:hypothetical protein D3C86_2081240 [compost metagenome]